MLLLLLLGFLNCGMVYGSMKKIIIKYIDGDYDVIDSVESYTISNNNLLTIIAKDSVFYYPIQNIKSFRILEQKDRLK